MVFSPGDFTGNHMLYNTGGNGSGAGFVIEGSVLEFRAQESPLSPAFVSVDLASLGAASDFYHVVGTVDVGATGTTQIFVNGNFITSATTTTGSLNDWDGSDLAGLGGGNFNIPGANPYSATAFTGSIATFNWYGGEILTPAEVTASYNALSPVPEPSAVLLSVIGLGLGITRRRR